MKFRLRCRSCSYHLPLVRLALPKLYADPSSYGLVFGPTNGANNATDYYFALVFVFLNQYDVNTCAEQTVVLANTSKYGELRSTEFPLHTLAVWSVKLIRHYSQIYILKIGRAHV